MTGSASALVVGEALVDVRTDERSGAGTVDEHVGGSPLNIAVGMARLGVPTTLAAQVAEDERGDEVAKHLAASGVDLLRLSAPPVTSTATARLQPDGSATYDFDLTWDPERLPDPADFALVHVGSIAAALPPGADRVIELVAAAGAAGVPVSYDPNVRLGATPDVEDVRRRAKVLAGGATVVKLSDEDAETLHPSVPVNRVARDLVGLPGVRLAAMTLGGRGLRLDTADGVVSVPAPGSEVVDTIGAGDTVMAALLVALLQHRLLEPGSTPQLDRATLGWLGELAVTAAAINCGRPGADPPWRSELPVLDERPEPGRPGHT